MVLSKLPRLPGAPVMAPCPTFHFSLSSFILARLSHLSTTHFAITSSAVSLSFLHLFQLRLAIINHTLICILIATSKAQHRGISISTAGTDSALWRRYTTTGHNDHATHEASYDKQRYLNVDRDIYCNLSTKLGADEDNGARLGRSFILFKTKQLH